MKLKRNRRTKEVGFFEAQVMMNDFIDNEMPNLKPAEVKLALVIFRKTIGWGMRSEQIGRTELCKRTKLDPTTVKRTTGPLCATLGIRVDQTPGVRRRYWWPMNERVAANLAKAEAAKGQQAGGELPPATRGQMPPRSRGQNAPTQSNPLQSRPIAVSRPGHPVNFGSDTFYHREPEDD